METAWKYARILRGSMRAYYSRSCEEKIKIRFLPVSSTTLRKSIEEFVILGAAPRSAHLSNLITDRVLPTKLPLSSRYLLSISRFRGNLEAGSKLVERIGHEEELENIRTFRSEGRRLDEPKILFTSFNTSSAPCNLLRNRDRPPVSFPLALRARACDISLIQWTSKVWAGVSFPEKRNDIEPMKSESWNISPVFVRNWDEVGEARRYFSFWQPEYLTNFLTTRVRMRLALSWLIVFLARCVCTMFIGIYRTNKVIEGKKA